MMIKIKNYKNQKKNLLLCLNPHYIFIYLGGGVKIYQKLKNNFFYV